MLASFGEPTIICVLHPCTYSTAKYCASVRLNILHLRESGTISVVKPSRQRLFLGCYCCVVYYSFSRDSFQTDISDLFTTNVHTSVPYLPIVVDLVLTNSALTKFTFLIEFYILICLITYWRKCFSKVYIKIGVGNWRNR